MPQEIIVTSVPRGLDGGSGFQTVKRTRGMPLAVAERLHQRSGYTHRFPAGDKRNPVVVSCRIERLRKGVYHVLSLTKDAGTDHSGRQNRLAHLIAFDEAEIFQKQAGPAPVAKKLRDARVFLDSWDQQPHESDAPVVISPRSEPGVCMGWRAAGFDPGLAGEMAASAIAGKRTVVIVPPETDVVSLFADAMLLMPPDARWRTTFTTSGSGNDDYIWQAVRADLPEAEAARNLPGVIDLTKSPSAADGPYVDFARSGKGTLPWQQPAVPEESTSVAPDSGSVATDSSAPDLNVPAPDAPEYVPPVDGSAPPDLAQTGVGGAPYTHAAGPKKRKLSDVSRRQREEPLKRQSNHIIRNAVLSAAACLFLIAIGLAVVFQKDIQKNLSSLTTNPSRVVQINNGDVPPSGPGLAITAEDQNVLNQKKKDVAEAKKKRLAAEQMAAEQKKKDAAAALGRQHRAFKQLSELPDAVSLNKGLPNLGLGAQETSPVAIGDVAIDELVDFEIALAKPKNSRMELVKSEADGDRSWVIEVTEDYSLDKKNVKKTLAEIYFKKGDGGTPTSELIIKPASVGVAKSREYKLLLRSALLLFAKEPKGINKAVAGKDEKNSGAEKDKLPKQTQIKLPKQINLVEATRGQSDSVKIVKNQNTAEIGLGVPPVLIDEVGKQTLRIDDLNIAIEVVSPCALNGQKGETTTAVTEKLEVSGQPDGDKRYHVPIFGDDLIRFFLMLDAQFEKNMLGVRLQWEVNQKPSVEQLARLNDLYRSVLLAKDEKEFKKAKTQQIKKFEIVFNKLCFFGKYPKSALKSPGAFSNYVQEQLSDVDRKVIKQIVEERHAGSLDQLSKKVAKEVDSALKLVKRDMQAPDMAIGITKPVPEAIYRRNCIDEAQKVMGREFTKFIKRLFEVCKDKFEKDMGQQREKLKPLFEMQTKIQVKKIHTEAIHDGEKYEIVLVDENATQSPGKSGSTKPTSLD